VAGLLGNFAVHAKEELSGFQNKLINWMGCRQVNIQT
jgi:hypothetical protein